MMTSKSSMLTSISSFGRLVPALLTRMLNGCAWPIAACIAARSVTSSTSASAFSPRARIAAAASSISALVRAASVTCAPAAASAEAAASPMPRPPPVTSARLPSRRNEGVLARSMAAIVSRVRRRTAASRMPRPARRRSSARSATRIGKFSLTGVTPIAWMTRAATSAMQRTWIKMRDCDCNSMHSRSTSASGTYSAKLP